MRFIAHARKNGEVKRLEITSPTRERAIADVVNRGYQLLSIAEEPDTPAPPPPPSIEPTPPPAAAPAPAPTASPELIEALMLALNESGPGEPWRRHLRSDIQSGVMSGILIAAVIIFLLSLCIVPAILPSSLAPIP